ncbi:MAG TPA: beta-N-acetylhexosaminidase [Gemmatimonadaceae bacterium]|nr:beta-N-acetylhexosaminidase [Gemmatimonadaceae bacterium]
MRLPLRTLLVLLVVGLSASPLRAQGDNASAQIAVIPRPQSIVAKRGSFALTPRTTIWSTKRDSAAARRLARDLAPATGFDLSVRVGSATSGNRIVFRAAPAKDTTLGPEGYRLEVKPGVITITSSAAAGAYYATQTIRQLLPPAIFREAQVNGTTWTMPAVAIVDRPRFPWRGMHLDVSRHFMPKEFVKKYIDLLALHKMNSFHWHLTDDQGWRIEIKKYPRLTDVGAWRSKTLVGRVGRDSTKWTYDNKPTGGFYTQDDVREIVQYAHERFVRVVPEIEMPGHSQAAIAAYPSLGNFGDTVSVWGSWGVSPYILNPSDTTIAFIQDVLTEVMALFPSEFIHVGGDEAIKPQWKVSPRAQSRIKELGLAPPPPENRDTMYMENELQSWFITKMDAFLTAKGRRMIGWDEILEGGLAPNAVVMSWRGIKGGLAAARAGHDVVMTPGDQTYFDHYQSKNTSLEPLAIGGFTPLDSAYAYDPVPAELEPQFAKHILGTQGQVWTEYIEGPKNVEYMAFPRVAAIAEVQWTAKAQKNFSDFSIRLARHLDRLQAMDVNFRKPDPSGPTVP